MDVNDAEAYDENVNDRPFDYSKKYIERNTRTLSRNHLTERSQASRSSKKEFRERDSKVDLFGDYAETDLDQPTDYSLRYAEDDTDEEEKENAEYFPGSEQEDTVKTYCTEGTPYETPFNFSTATSMSDLRIEDTKDNDLPKKLPKKVIEMDRKSPVSFIKQVVELDVPEDLVTKELEENPKDPAVLNLGQVTPEKIVSYYEEGTSQGFSRANSLSSLSSAVTSQNNITEAVSKIDSSDSPNKEELENVDHNILQSNQIGLTIESNSPAETKDNPRIVDKEGKMVTFGGQNYYAEETPLMFSRSSSLGSLSGFEQHSIHDDRSSVVSDFSRRTSGAVSPSELPDSPTQTVLPSPRNHKTQNAEFISKIQEEAVRPSVRHLSYPKPHIARSSIFEDEVASFKEESTPIEFSSATSLSSLIIDDEVKISDENTTKTHCRLEKESDADKKDVHELQTDMLNMVINTENKTKEEQVSDINEEDEDMLAACITRGMQTNKYRQSFKTLNSQTSIQSESSSISAPYQTNSMPNRLESHVSVASVEAPISTSKTDKTAIEIVAVPDTVHVYCTEDTPADISPVGSQSNLSALSMPSVQEEQDRLAEIECSRNDLFNDSTHLSCEDEKILNECIQSGMQKSRKTISSPTNSVLLKKPETLHKFNICDTPLSSPVETGHVNKNSTLAKSPGNELSRHTDELSDDSPIHSEDEALLAECIQSAMSKIRFGKSPSIRTPLSRTVENPKMTSVQTPSTSSAYFQPEYVEQRKSMTKKPLSSEDNMGLSEEENIILAQCIRSGMPKVLKSLSAGMASAVKKSEPCSRVTNFSPPLSSYSPTKVYSGKNTVLYMSQSYKPANINTMERFSKNISNNYNCFPRKTMNNLTQSFGQILRSYDTGICERMNNLPYHARRLTHVETDNGNSIDNHFIPSSSRIVNRIPIVNRTGNNDHEPCRDIMKSNVVPSRHNPASFLNENSSQITAEEWDLQDVCVTCGTLRNKSRVKGRRSNEGAIPSDHHDTEVPISEDNYSVCSYNSYVPES